MIHYPITPNDLRVGNYVRLKVNQSTVEVVSVDRERVGVSRPGSNLLMYVSYSEIAPLPIERADEAFEWPQGLIRESGENFKTHYLYGFGAVREELPLWDMHELQNLHYALTGREIDVDINAIQP